VAKDGIDIRVTTPGADESQRKLQGVANAQQQVGRKGRRAGQDLTKANRASKASIDELGQALGVNTRLFKDWRMAGVAAVTAIAAGVAKLFQQISAYNAELSRAVEKAANQTGQAGVRSLANIRGSTQTEALLSTYQQAVDLDISRATAEQMSFAIESGLSPSDVGGAAGIREIEKAAGMTAAISGASGSTVGGLALTAREALGASRPAEFKSFFAKALTYAKSSRVSLEELGGVLNETLPLAVKAGIDPDRFMAMAASMSFRIKEPTMVRTALRQMIAATTRPSDALGKMATEAGRNLSAMSASDIMALQGSMLAQAAVHGPQAIGRAVEAMGLPVEIGQVYMQTTDRAAAVRQGSLMRAGRSATFAGAIGSEHQALMNDALSKYRRAQTAREMNKLKTGLTVKESEAAIKEAQAFLEGAVSTSGEAVRSKILGTSGGKARSIAVQTTRDQLEMIAAGGNYPDDLRKRAQEAANALGGAGQVFYESTGLGERQDLEQGATIVREAEIYTHELIRSRRSGDTYNGGTHFHNNDKHDPAGEPVQRMAP